ncbi:hypothetical protein DACRYDRAFT_112734 [Dacryopinax primogenitus]|uniref:protein-histidine N-methyltransferase n=1 Tax=Dacryopinax primogenitus (strain DJM 731) TaxID=1858805 RepID=M5FNM7_DACPD|nr:uncharacterized protein DACRYDRAFT_112734 [Dacryopinax primogenitus]EJT96468.1 hypothetical protein DACRYDRAFT_112734 [Dacryopinax primogenitus]
MSAQPIRVLPVELSYTVLSSLPLPLPRRDFHDARLSILASAFSQSSTSDILHDTEDEHRRDISGVDERKFEEVFNERSDVRPGLYEGGMKTWEGAVDLVNYLSDNERRTAALSQGSILEIGSGTALPTLFLLAKIFQSEGKEDAHERAVFLQDYNLPVLELMTFPNILLTWYLYSPSAAMYRFPHPPVSPGQPISLRLSSDLLSSFRASLTKLKLSLRFWAGDWDMLDVGGRVGLVLTSETIYRPEAVPSLARCIRRALEQPASSGSRVTKSGQETLDEPSVCLLAAKDVYFGVGGSVAEFEQVAQRLGMVGRRVWEVTEGSGRCILEMMVR